MKNDHIFHPETSECTHLSGSEALDGLLQSRRQFLSRFGQGMGAIGLATLLGPQMAAPVQGAAFFPARAAQTRIQADGKAHPAYLRAGGAFAYRHL
jgi:hypothetical protein